MAALALLVGIAAYALLLAPMTLIYASIELVPSFNEMCLSNAEMKAGICPYFIRLLQGIYHQKA